MFLVAELGKVLFFPCNFLYIFQHKWMKTCIIPKEAVLLALSAYSLVHIFLSLTLITYSFVFLSVCLRTPPLILLMLPWEARTDEDDDILLSEPGFHYGFFPEECNSNKQGLTQGHTSLKNVSGFHSECSCRWDPRPITNVCLSATSPTFTHTQK